ncbi:efflux RND transporter permease subunit [Sediminitomix flava]|uniref:Multidrug efflux pump subunit AcrB n=1 Tax=Sediminitomix flava TaxID=379075 RepID=A0A315ZCJ8_SEDFL|nr:efflux RND transporter permease subunit [Sediminitomix flava]PWJ42823.1 multidrug efflux pump subunit AcrB [Sediminitomix flava]
MRKIVENFVKYGILSNTIIALTLIFGALAVATTNKAFFPERPSRYINVSVAYPGASPEEMEEGITQRIEEAIRNIVGIYKINSTSRENFVSVSVETTESADIDEVLTEIKNAVDGISGFPAGAERPIVSKNKARSPVMWLAFTAEQEGVGLNDLKKALQKAEEEMLSSGVVSQINIFGFPSREISIEVSEETLLKYQLTFDEVVRAVRNNNRDVSGGIIKTNDEEIIIRSRARENEAARIGNLVLRASNTGNIIRLSDIGTIKEEFEDVPNYSTYNSKPSAYMFIQKLNSEDLQKVSEFAVNYVEKFNKENSHIHINVAYRFLDMLNQRLDMLISNGAVGVLLVCIALGFFLSLRLSLWVAWGIPSSFLGLFIFGAFAGLTINMISLFGMIMVVGILVDDGIVIAENIYSHFEKGKTPWRAAVDGAMEVIPSVFTSVSTTIVIFIPFLWIEGSLSFLRDLSMVVIFSLAFSLIEAFLVLPAHLASPSVLEKRDPNKKGFYASFRNTAENIINFLRFKIYAPSLEWTIKNRYVSMAIILAAFTITGGLLAGGYIKATFFPRIPFNSLRIDIAFKAGERDTKTTDYIARFDDLVWEMNEDLKRDYNDTTNWIDATISDVGGSKFGSGGHTGKIDIFYKELEDAPFDDIELVNRLQEKIGEVPEAEKLSIGNDNQFGKPVEIRLMSSNAQQLEDATAFLKEKLQGISELQQINDSRDIGKRELQIDLKPQAYALGLERNDIVRQIRQGFFGEEAQRFQKGRDEIRVWVRYPKMGRISIAQLENMKVKFQGKEYFVKELVDYKLERGVASIKHYMGNRTMSVDAELVNPETELPPILEQIDNKIVPELLAKFPDVRKESGGQAEESQRSGQQMMLLFGTGFVMMFIIILLNFRSFYQAVLILAMIPLGWLGSAWGHGIHGLPISMLSGWGMIALAGVIVNDAVVFLDKYNRNLKEGMKAKDAAFSAGIARFRPIMLTSITTVVGLYPLILETSLQAQILIPMALAIAWGVLVGTILILLFFPVLILIFNDIRRSARRLWSWESVTAEEVERVIIDAKKDLLLEDTPTHSNGHAPKSKISLTKLNGHIEDTVH